MQVNPIFYEYPHLYGKLYVGGHEVSLKLGRAVELLAAVIPEYTHQDVYLFLTDSKFRHSILTSKQNYIENKHLRSVWINQHERELNKKRWYVDSLEIIKHLITCEEPKPISSNRPEYIAYKAIESSNQLLIPVYRYWTGEDIGTLTKTELLTLLTILGIEFFEPGWSGTLSLGIDTNLQDIPYIHVRVPALSFFDNQHPFVGSIEIYLPKNEMVSLKEAIINFTTPNQI